MYSATATFQSVKILFQRGGLRQIGTSTLFAAVVLLLSGILMLGVNVTKLNDSFAWVQRSNDVLLQIYEADAKLVGIEMTVRGYALTDDPAFLGYQQYELDRLKIAMDRLAALVADDAGQTDRFKQVRVFVARRLTLYAHLSSLGPGHAQDVAAAITDPGKRRDMLSARLQLNALRDEELRLLAERQEATARQAAYTYKLAIGIVILAFGISALGLVFMLYGRSQAGQRNFVRGS